MIAICSMIRKPLNFETWLVYHFSIGVEYIFLRVEETPELQEIIDKYPNKVFAEYYNEVSKIDNYYTIQDRQRLFIDKSIQDSLEYPIRWMFHIDCDELIWTKETLISILTPISKRFDCVHFQNFEAVYAHDNIQNVFTHNNRFIRCRDGECLSYANGKSVGRVSKSLRSYGPHFFTGKVYNVNDRLGAILHFDSPNFDEWYNKFKNLSNNTPEMFKKIPFKFYRESIDIIKSENIEDARNYYNKMKILTYNNKNNIEINF